MTHDIDDPELPLSELFGASPGTMRVFWRRRMACVGCPIAPFHTVADACRDYGIDEAAFRAELRAAAEATPPRRSGSRGGAARSR